MCVAPRQGHEGFVKLSTCAVLGRKSKPGQYFTIAKLAWELAFFVQVATPLC